MYVFIYIYTVYVIVEHEMWLLHFIFEGPLFTFFKTAGKDVTLRQNEMMVRERVKKKNDQKLPGRNQKKEKERAIALIAFEDISDGGGVYNN